MTHGHFDHVGVLETLAAQWDVEVYSHPDGLSFLNGTSSTPPPDPGMGGGLMSRLSRNFDSVAVPQGGQYVDHPARASDRSAYREGWPA